MHAGQAQAAVGAMGFPILCEVIREERKDLDMLRTALECLTNAFTSPAASSQVQQARTCMTPTASRVGHTSCSQRSPETRR